MGSTGQVCHLLLGELESYSAMFPLKTELQIERTKHDD